jgi:hypothetical protein
VLKDNKSYSGGRKGGRYDVQMTCTTGATLFDRYNITHVDWMDLDAEGHEASVLKGIDFDKVRIDVITVEANDKKVRQILNGLGYRLHKKLHYDWLFLRKDFALLGSKSSH